MSVGCWNRGKLPAGCGLGPSSPVGLPPVLFLLTVEFVLCRPKGSACGLHPWEHLAPICGPVCSGTAKAMLVSMVPRWPCSLCLWALQKAPPGASAVVPSLRSLWESHTPEAFSDISDASWVSLSAWSSPLSHQYQTGSCVPHTAQGLFVHCCLWSQLTAWHTVGAQ